MSRWNQSRLLLTALAASVSLTACGGSAIGVKAPRATLTGDRPVLQAKNALAEAPAEVILTTPGMNAKAPQLAGGKLLESFSFNGKTFHLFDVGNKSFVQKAVAAARGLTGVQHADANVMMYALDTDNEPDDEFYGLQFGLVQKQVPAAWNVTAGDPNMIVAVVDTGVDYNHPDLKGRVVQGADLTFRKGLIFNRKDKDGPMDDNGHGTHCAGIIGATADNGIGIAGVAPKVNILAVKVLGGKGGGSSFDVMRGVAHAIVNGAKIVNMSLGGTMTTSVERAFYETDVANSGALVVAAAGNSADALGFPAAYRNVLSVGATDSGGVLASFSNHDVNMSVTAPGVGILSTLPGNTYAKFSGTSMAAPFVSGVAALVWSAHPAWTAAEVKAHIEKTAQDRGPAGVDASYGHGEVDVKAALGL